MLFPLAPPPTLAVATREEVVLLSDAGEPLRRLPLAARRLEWSPDGRTLAVLLRDGRLLTVGATGEPTTVAEDASEPVWSADGRLFHTQGAKGVFAGAVPVVPTGHAPAPSPDAARLAFATDGVQGGVWTAAADGSGARRLLRGARTDGVSWSYDGRWIAAVVDGRLRLVRPNGLAARDLGPVAGGTALWSAGAPEILARRGASWSVVGFLDGSWTDVDLDAAPTPRWTGPRRLLGVRNGTAVEVAVGGEAAPVSKEVAVDAARVVGTYRGAAFPDPFRDAPRPRSGGVAWQGQILSVDPVGGMVTISVDTEIDARGREKVLGRPVVRRPPFPPGALGRRLAVLPETEVRLILYGGRVTDAFLPDAPTAPAPTPGARVPRPRRTVEYDGITRERVVVPLVHPMPGRYKDYRDNFLDPRVGHRHQGNDLMAPKMTPLLAVFEGVVSFGRSRVPGGSNTLYLQSDDGWTAAYLHINNDTPGTNDGLGSFRYAFPADLQPGDRVRAGQVVAWCGNSGNAETTGPHLHFELHDNEGGATVDPWLSLRLARRRPAPLYPDPDPLLRTAKGEVRWDGVVLSVDRAKRALAVELTGAADPGRLPARNLKPRVVYLTVPVGKTLRYRGADLAYPLDAVQPGMLVSGAGTVQGARMTVRAASMALASG